jgi:hypothetical protein
MLTTTAPTFGPARSYYLKTTEGTSHDFGFREPAEAKFFGLLGTAQLRCSV